MKKQIKRGLGFGITSGIITTIGLMVGLYSGTHARDVVLGGIVAIAIADALSDSLGMHVSEETSNKKSTEKQIWAVTFSTLFFKFITAGIFILAILLIQPLQTAIILNIVLGFVGLISFTYYISKERGASVGKAITEHVLVAVLVIVVTYFVGKIL